MEKRKEPMPLPIDEQMPIEEPKMKTTMHRLSPDEIEFHREFVEEEEPGDIEPILRFLPPADAEQVRSVTRQIDVKKLKQRSKEILDKYAAQGYVEVPVMVMPPSLSTPPGRVSEERVKRLRRFMEHSFRPIPETALSSRFFSESQAEVIRNFNRVCLKAEVKLKAKAAKALQEYDAKGYLECTAEGKIKVSD
jgi:hypothetical protein